MAAVKEATIEIEGTGRYAIYLAEGEETAPGIMAGASTLTIQVQDFHEALALVETLSRSVAQKKRAAARPVADEKPSDGEAKLA